MNLVGPVILFFGLLSIVGGIFDWDWFMNHHKAQFVCTKLGRNRARVFYVILGVVLFLLGILSTLMSILTILRVIQDAPR